MHTSVLYFVGTPKKKKHHQFSWRDRFLGARHIDFVSPLPLAAALSEMERLHQSRRDYSPIRSVQLNLIDEDTYSINMVQTNPRSPRIQVTGLVKRWTDDSTYITVNIRPHWIGILSYGLLPLMIVVSMATSTQSPLAWGSLLMMAGLWIYFRWHVHRSASDLQHALETLLQAEASS